MIAAIFFVGQSTVPFVVGVVSLALLINRPATDDDSDELAEWWQQSRGFAKQILPLLFWGVLVSGFLLAGPALSLPNMLVIRSVLGTTKTAVFVSLVIVMATLTGILYGVMVS